MSVEYLAKSFLSPVVPAPVMEPEDEIRNLRAENIALAERLRQTPDVREIIRELRDIDLYYCHDPEARKRLRALLRRIDRESK